MSTEIVAKSETLQSREWFPYAVKAVVVLALLFLASRLVPILPAWGVGILWAAFTMVLTVGVLYHATIRKTYNQKMYKTGSFLSRFKSGRVCVIVVGFVMSAAAMAGLLVDSPKWGVSMWLVLVAAVPLYWVISRFMARWLEQELAELHRQSWTAVLSAAVTAAIMCVVAFVILWLQPAESYRYAADAFLAVPKPFDEATCKLLKEVGGVVALTDGLTAYVLSRMAADSFGAYVVWRIVLYFAAFMGVTGLLAVCAIDLRELKRGFIALEGVDGWSLDAPLLKLPVVLVVALPLVLVVGFQATEAKAAELADSSPYIFVKDTIRDAVGLVVYQYDGKYYNEEAVKELLARASEESESLQRQAEEELVPLINASFDARIANVDSYLDWYYRLFGDWEMLFEAIKGNAEQFAADQFVSHIEQGVDDSKLEEALGAYVGKAAALKESIRAELDEYEAVEYPDWLITHKDEVRLDDLFAVSLEPSQHFIDASGRLGISAGAGIVTGVIAKKLVAKAAHKTFFKEILKRIAGLAGASAVASGSGPGVVIGIVAIPVVDIAMTKADELAHRESYRQELVDTINEQRQEALAVVGAA